MHKLGEEDDKARKFFYLITFSRILPETLAVAGGALRDVATLQRKEIGRLVLNAFNEPLPPMGGGGRPRRDSKGVVRKIAVFLEQHADGSKHFHVAVYLNTQVRWSPVKRTLRVRERLASHFSCSHDFWWSVLRYGTEFSMKDDVDDKPDVWLAKGEVFDLFEESQEQYQANASVARRQKRDLNAAKEGKAVKFTKYDLTSLVLSKGLDSRAQVMRYVQDRGTTAMQLFVNKHQKFLNDYLEEAAEWAGARLAAEKEDLTDWALVCNAADSTCRHGQACRYAQVSQQILDKNKASFDRRHLANSIRKIINMGPCKEARVPFLIGATNTGKSTLVDSLDDLFHWKQVFHLPAVTDQKFALRNWVKGKRFAYFDEYSPVEYAQMKIISVTTFKKAFGGKYFEIQLPKNWSDGNVDFKWNRGALFTNKEVGLWEPVRGVSAEDINHMKSRVELFHLTHTFAQTGGEAVPECRCCFAKWIVEACAAFDASQGLQSTTLLPVASLSVDDLDVFLARARVPVRVQMAINTDVVALGAVDVAELSQADWESLPSWPLLKNLERRRILAMVPPDTPALVGPSSARPTKRLRCKTSPQQVL